MSRPSDRVAAALRHAGARLGDLLRPGHRLVVAFSGGQDSTCLLHALTRLGGLDLVAGHVDHGLRADSAEAARRAADLATAIGVPIEVRRADVAGYRRRVPGWSVQQAARAARYQVLASLLAEVGGEALLLGHTADDQAETVLLRLLRGAGLAGLAGMRLDETIAPARLGPPLAMPAPPPDRLRLARPLLRVERTTTLAYCSEFGLPVIEDPSNQSRAYTRNRIRLDLLPVLERFNPAIRSLLARTADLAAEDELALDDLARSAFGSLARRLDAHTIEYDLDAWRSRPRAIQRRLLRLGLDCLLGSLVDVAAAPIEDALDLLASHPAGRAYHLPYGVELCTRSGSFVLRLHGRARPRERANS